MVQHKAMEEADAEQTKNSEYLQNTIVQLRICNCKRTVTLYT